jgi:hypothetical protein
MPATRRLAEILAADVVGYSRLMGEDEAGTALSVREHREAARPVATSAERSATSASRVRREKAALSRAGCLWLESIWGFPNRRGSDSTCWLGGGSRNAEAIFARLARPGD